MIHSRAFTIFSHMQNAFHVMDELRESNELCDIVLCVEKQEFHAHKVVLAGCSPYLRAMFTNGMLETEKNIIELHGIERSTLSILLDFMYKGTIEISVDNVQAVLQGASLLNLYQLRTVCSHFLETQLDSSNCLGIHSFADMYSCSELEASARRYIYQHFLDVIQHEEFFQLSQERLLDLLKSDKLQVNSERQVLEAAMSWIEASPINRIPDTAAILQHIRFALLDMEYLENVVLQTDFIRSCPKCQNIVAKAMRIKSDNNALALVGNRAQPPCIFVVGGRNSTDCQLKSMERYDFLRDQWIPMGNMNIARTAVGAATLNGMLYAVGGECALADSQDDTMYLQCVECYDPIMKVWISKAKLKVSRSFISVAATGGFLYALGGEDRTSSFNIMERYDPEMDSWSTVKSACFNLLIVVGGEDRTSSFNIMERYDPEMDSWSTVKSMQRKRAGAGVAVCDGKIYVAGGYDKTSHTDRASVECYDPETDQWSFVAEMEKARSGLNLVAMDNYLYAFGGRSRHNDEYFDLAERYNTVTHQWHYISPMNTPRAWPAVAVYDERIFVIGGFDGFNRLRSAELFNPTTDSWMYISNMNVSRAGCGAAVV